MGTRENVMKMGENETEQCESREIAEPSVKTGLVFNGIRALDVNDNKSKQGAHVKVIEVVEKSDVGDPIVPFFKCPQPGCAASYAIKSGLKQHLAIVHKEMLKKSPSSVNAALLHSSLKVCPLPECGATFEDLQSLSKHLEMLHKRFLCPEQDCGAFFTRIDNKNKHCAVAHRNKKLPCPQQNCGKTFSGPFNLKRHIMNTHTDGERFVCPVEGCGKTFKWKTSVQKHQKTSHGGKNNNFNYDQVLAVSSSQPTDEAFFFTTTDSTASSKSAVLPPLDSRKTSSSKKSLPCSGFKVYKKEAPSGHQPLFQCREDSCVQSFANAKQLGKHVRAYHVHFSCPEDGCKFTSVAADRLKTHTKCVHGTRSIECPVDNCGKCFSMPKQLFGHIKSMHKEFKFSCPDQTCIKTFGLPSKLKKHVLNHHQLAFPDFTVLQAISRASLPAKPDDVGNCQEVSLSDSASVLPKLHACPEDGCGAEFTKEDQLYRHLRVQHIKKEQELLIATPAKCSPLSNFSTPGLTCPHKGCERTFKWKQSLKHHIKSQHNCDKIDEHKMSSNNGKPKLLKKNSVMKSLRNQQIQGKYACPCKGCNWSFSSRQGLKSHVEAKHGLADLQVGETPSTSAFSQEKVDSGSDAKTVEVKPASHAPQGLHHEEDERLGISEKDESKGDCKLTLAVSNEGPKGPFQCSVPECSFVGITLLRTVAHLNNKHSFKDLGDAHFKDLATGATLDLFATCKFIIQCKVCMKVRTANDHMNHLVANMKTHIVKFHSEELEAMGGSASPLYKVLQDGTGRRYE